MILYHGSNMEVRNPKLIPSKRLLDFGNGFYLTSDAEQAGKWAVRTASSREEGLPVVSVFEIDTKKLENLKVLRFEKADGAWLNYISDNRRGKASEESFDVVIGPVANDQAIRTINNYLKGYFPEDIAIRLLLPQKLKDQYAFKTEEALALLIFKEVRKV